MDRVPATSELGGSGRARTPLASLRASGSEYGRFSRLLCLPVVDERKQFALKGLIDSLRRAPDVPEDGAGALFAVGGGDHRAEGIDALDVFEREGISLVTHGVVGEVLRVRGVEPDGWCVVW